MIVRLIASHNVYLPSQNCAAHNHGDCNNWEIDAGEFESLNVNMLARQDIPPKKPRERCAECSAKCAVIYSNCHAVHGGPKCAITDVGLIYNIDLLPRLNDSGQQDGRTNVRASKLRKVSIRLTTGTRRECGKTYIA